MIEPPARSLISCRHDPSNRPLGVLLTVRRSAVVFQLN
jgi:hypothetical protein